MKKLLLIQKELRAPKKQFNAFGKYNYRSAEDILEAVKPLLFEQNYIITITDELVNLGDRYYVKATATIKDAESEDSTSVSAFAREEETKKGMDGAQITGSASSYARKYALNGLLAIDDNKDGDRGGGEEKEIDYSKIDELKINLSEFNNYKELFDNRSAFRDDLVKAGMPKKEATELVQSKLKELE